MKESLFFGGHIVCDGDTIDVGHIEAVAFWVDTNKVGEVTVTVCFTSHVKNPLREGKSKRDCFMFIIYHIDLRLSIERTISVRSIYVL